KLLTPDQLVEKASEHEVSMQNLASRRLKKLRDDGEDVPDVIDESELAGKGRIKQKFAGSSFGELFEDVDGIDDDDVKEACVRLMLTKMLQAAAALDRIDMVHRDLHDGNITMGENGQVKLIDFGLAKRKGDSDLKLEMTSGVGAKGEYGFKPPPETENAISSIYKKGATKADLAAASSFSSSSKADVYGVGFLMSGRTNQILKTPRKEMVDLMNELQADVPADRPSAADALTRLKAFDTGHEAAAETQLQGFAKARIQKTLAEPTTTVASE
ncbi:MAG: protein kinase, partial [Myxococcota bacterium]